MAVLAMLVNPLCHGCFCVALRRNTKSRVLDCQCHQGTGVANWLQDSSRHGVHTAELWFRRSSHGTKVDVSSVSTRLPFVWYLSTLIKHARVDTTLHAQDIPSALYAPRWLLSCAIRSVGLSASLRMAQVSRLFI